MKSNVLTSYNKLISVYNTLKVVELFADVNLSEIDSLDIEDEDEDEAVPLSQGSDSW